MQVMLNPEQKGSEKGGENQEAVASFPAEQGLDWPGAEPPEPLTPFLGLSQVPSTSRDPRQPICSSRRQYHSVIFARSGERHRFLSAANEPSTDVCRALLHCKSRFAFPSLTFGFLLSILSLDSSQSSPFSGRVCARS